MYNPPAMFPIPIKDPIKVVVQSGAADSERTSATIPPTTKNE
jgi:hypothetical protein